MSSDNGVRRPAVITEMDGTRRVIPIGTVTTDVQTGVSMVWDGKTWTPASEPPPFGVSSGLQRPAVSNWRARRASDHPVYLVPEKRAHFLYLRAEMPKFRAMDMTLVPEGTIVVEEDSTVWQAFSAGGGGRRWYSHGRAVHHKLLFEVTYQGGAVQVSEDPYRAHLGVVRMSMEDLALLVSYWYCEEAGRAEELRNTFWDDLLVQMHRPAARREASMLITKTQTRRGRASDRKVDPLTPWALRAGAEKLLGDVTEDVAAGDHGSDALYLKRVLDIRHRRQQLLDQLNEVDGYLQATEAILLSQKVTA